MNRDRRRPKQTHGRIGPVILMVTGGILSGVNVVRLAVFVSRLDAYPRLTPAQVWRLLVLPHVLMLTGAGMLLAGVLVLGRRMIERTRR